MKTVFSYRLFVTINMYEALINNEKVGQFGIQLGTDCVYIYSVMIREDLRGRRLGYKMMKKALRMAARYRGIAVLHVHPSNAVAIHLYEKLGFKKKKDSEIMEAKLW